ncbi:MAG: S8 family serine peptidase [Eubacterium sp.]|nr:S8 family serine peptidase [Eubacterium sp.]
MSRLKDMKAGRVMAGVLAATLILTGLPAGLAGTTSVGDVTAEAAETTTSSAIAFSYAKNYGGSYTDAFTDVVYTNDGGYVAVGYTLGDSTDPTWDYAEGSTSGYENYYNDIVLVKFSSEGVVEWSQAYGDAGTTDLADAVTVLSDGTIAVAGKATFSIADDSDTTLIKNASSYVLLVNPEDGTDYTEIHYGGTSGDYATGIEATSDGGFVVSGYSASDAGYYTYTTDQGTTYEDAVQLWESASGTDDSIANRASSKADTYLIKFDIATDGSISNDYVTMYNADSTTYGNYAMNTYAMTTDSNGDFVIACRRQLCKNRYAGCVAKFDGDTGELTWEKIVGTTSTTVPTDYADYLTVIFTDVTTLSDGSYVVVGTATNDAQTEEGWECYGSEDVIVLNYSSDGTFVSANNYGTISETAISAEGVVATDDGGYMVYGTASEVVVEDELIEAGYDYGNYGGNDGIIVKYDSDNTVSWSENYGTASGDWINGMAVDSAGQVIAVGESNGTYGNIAWDNNGGIDGILMTTGTLAEYSEAEVEDGDVIWQDGTYTGSGNGYNGSNSVILDVTIEDHKITNIETNSTTDTEIYFESATAIYESIINSGTSDVDTVSSATYSCNGIIDAVNDALSQAAAAYVDSLIGAIATADDAQTATNDAAAAYSELGTAARGYLENLSTLETYANTYGITLTVRESEEKIEETEPETSSDLAYSDTYYKLQKEYYEDINASALADASLTGEGVKIAVIDSGLTYSHDDIDYDNIATGYDYDNDVELTSENLYDDDGHGTAVTSILQAISDNGKGISGLLSQATIVPLKVTPVYKVTSESNIEKSKASSETVAQIIKDAVDTYDVDVITTSMQIYDTDALEEAVDYAADNGVIIVGAAGNSSTSSSTGEDDYVYPAAYDNVISVGAVDSDMVVRTNSQKNDTLDVVAPGEDIAVLYPSVAARTTISSGTSYSSPIVAAMAVAAKQVRSDLTIDEFRNMLQETSTDAGDTGYDTSYGYGIVNMQSFAELQSKTLVTYKLYGGAFESEDYSEYNYVTSGTKITLPAITKDGYEFAGWQIGDGIYEAGETYEITEDVTVTALWNEIFTITYKVNGGSYTDADSVVSEGVSGTTITLPEIARSGYEFLGWQIGDDIYEAGDTYIITEDVTITALWDAEYTVTYNVNGGKLSNGSKSVTVTSGESVTLPSVSRTGYTFKGWKIGSKTYSAGAKYTVTSNVTATAQWKKITTRTISGITYKISGSSAVVSAAKKSIVNAVIPSKVTIGGKSYKVTKINSKVFAKHTKLKSVTIGANVKTIGSKAFFKATSLKKVVFKGKNVKSIGSKAFKKINKKVTYKYPSKKKKTAYQKLLKKAGASNLS